MATTNYSGDGDDNDYDNDANTDADADDDLPQLATFNKLLMRLTRFIP